MKTNQKQHMKAFDAFYSHANEPEYPYLLAISISKSNQEFEKSRAYKLLGDWVREYENMSQIMKYKYSQNLPKIFKILQTEFTNKTAMDYCIGYFFCIFHKQWKEMRILVKDLLEKSDSYSLQFIWYMCFYFIDNLNSSKQLDFCEYLSELVELPLRKFIVKEYVYAKKLLEIIYLLNIKNCKSEFKDNANSWVESIQKIEDLCEGESKLQIIITIIKNRQMMINGEKSCEYWKKKVGQFIELIEQRIEGMSINIKLDVKILDNFINMISFPEVISILESQVNRFLKSLIAKMKPNENPNNIFNIEKYREIRIKLYNIFFEKNTEQTFKRVEEILKKFKSGYYTYLTEDQNYYFLDSISERPVKIDDSILRDIIRLLENSHRTQLSTKTVIILVKILNASLEETKVAEEDFSKTIKSFNEVITHKINDPSNFQLKIEISKYFLVLLQKFNWQDQKKTEMIFNFCDEFEKNSKKSEAITIKILTILVRKYQFIILNNMLQKFKAMINDIALKIIYDKNGHNTVYFISLMLIIYRINKWNEAIEKINSVSKYNEQKEGEVFLLQADIIMKENDLLSPTEERNVINLISNKNLWSEKFISINLTYLEILFMKINKYEAFKILKAIDAPLLKILKQFYQENNFTLMTCLTAKILPSVASLNQLKKLDSYLFMKMKAFQILAKSFYKTTSIYMCCFFSMLLLKADSIVTMFRELNVDSFLDYLYQGLNDFITKQKRYNPEIVLTILVFKIFKIQPEIYSVECSRLQQFTTLIKNIGWWDEEKNPINFKALAEQTKTVDDIILPQYEEYYQKTVKDYINNYYRLYLEAKSEVEREREERINDLTNSLHQILPDER